MDFPAYVPTGARSHIQWTLEGGNSWQGVNTFIEEYRINPDATEALAELEQERACLLRFAHDVRMRDVYAHLQKVVTTDEQIAQFLESAWTAHMDYTPFRKRVRSAKEIAPKIAKAARELSELLNRAGDVGGGVAPDEFFSIRALLDATDNHDDRKRNLRMWRGMRGIITGADRLASPPDDSTPQGDEPPNARQVLVAFSEEEACRLTAESPSALIVRVVAARKDERTPEQEQRADLMYAWGTAPGLPAILETVARAAEEWEPGEGGAIGAAIVSRKANRGAEYVRALAALLRRDAPELDLSGSMPTAMAGVANVVLNDQSIDVSPDAVRMTLAAIPTPKDSV